MYRLQRPAALSTDPESSCGFPEIFGNIRNKNQNIASCSSLLKWNTLTSALLPQILLLLFLNSLGRGGRLFNWTKMAAGEHRKIHNVSLKTERFTMLALRRRLHYPSRVKLRNDYFFTWLGSFSHDDYPKIKTAVVAQSNRFTSWHVSTKLWKAAWVKGIRIQACLYTENQNLCTTDEAQNRLTLTCHNPVRSHSSEDSDERVIIVQETAINQQVSGLVFGLNIFDLDHGVQVDSVKEPILRDSVAPRHVSHHRTSPLDDHLDHSSVIFKDVQLGFALRKSPFLVT